MAINPPIIELSVPAKAILFGEHAVVYGKRAIATSVGLRNRLKLSVPASLTRSVRLQLPGIQLDQEWTVDQLIKNDAKSNSVEHIRDAVEEAFRKDFNAYDQAQKSAAQAFLVLYILLVKRHSVDKEKLSMVVEVQSEIPVGAGLGSSASYSVCIASALLIRFGLLSRTYGESSVSICVDDLDIINEWAFMAETIIHGNPSGLDNTICTYGGAVSFKKDGSVEHLSNFPSFRFLLIHSNVPRDTKKQVAVVKSYYEEFPNIVKPVLDAIGAISDAFIHCLNEKQDLQIQTLERLIDMNHRLISALGVGHPVLDHIRLITQRYGLVSKLTGAGGGGCVLTFIPTDNPEPELSEAVSELSAAGFQCIQVELGVPGVCLDMK